MKEIIIASANAESAERIRAILHSGQLFVNRVFSSGSEVLSYASVQPDVLVVCGKLSDMTCYYLAELAPNGVQLLHLQKSGEPTLGFYSNLVTLNMPIDRSQLIGTARMLACASSSGASRPAVRSRDDEEMLGAAKRIIMARLNISEPEAHRLLLRRSMETGLKLIELAKMIGDERFEIH